MRFIYPDFLPALLFISIPILIHFLHFKRYKTVYFSQVNFLKAIKEDTKKKNNLKQLFILISRILTIIALVFVFAQPYLPANKQERKVARKLVAIYVDNSFSLKNESDNGILLEQAKNKAMSIASSYGPGTSFILMDNQNLPEQQAILNQAQLINQLASIQESPGSLTIANAYQLLSNNLRKQESESEKTIYLVSDFQEYTSDLAAINADTTAHAYFIPLSNRTANNLLIDSCWFETPGHKKNREETLFVRIRNLSGQSYQNVPVRLKINDTIKSINTISIEPEKEQEIKLVYKNNRSGVHRGVVELDDYPIVYDNQFYFSYDVRERNNVLAIYQPEDENINKLQALFSEDENINFEQTEVKKTQVSQFQNYQCIYLLNLNDLSSGLINALTKFVRAGGSLAVFPAENAHINSYNQLFGSLQAEPITGADSTHLVMEQVNYNHPLLQHVFLHAKENIDLPFVDYSFRLASNTHSSRTNIITFNNTQTAVSEYPVSQGRLFCFSFPLNDERTDFSQHPIFVPLLYNIALNSFDPQEIQHEITNNLVLTLPKNELLASGQAVSVSPFGSNESIHLSLLNQQNDQVRIDFQNTIRQAGFYTLKINGETDQTLAFNFNRQESLSPPLTESQIKKAIEQANLQAFDVISGNESNFVEKIQEANEGIELWQLFLLLSLLFIATEIALTRFWK